MLKEAAGGRTTGARFLVRASDAGAGSLQSDNNYFEGRIFCVFENTFKLKDGMCVTIEKRVYTRDDVSAYNLRLLEEDIIDCI